MVPVFEGKKLAGWTGWDPAVRKREVGDGERAVATPVYPAWSREAPLFPGRLVCYALDNLCRGRASLSHGPTHAVVGVVGSGATGVLAY
jgi:hypothetical protein